METKHTSGPWEVTENGYYYEIIASNGGFERALSISVHLHEKNSAGDLESNSLSDENRANALLIAAAPEMLDMIQTYLNDLNNIVPQSDARDNRIDQVESLIKKAIGQQEVEK